MKMIKLLKEYNGEDEGTVVEVDEDTAAKLIKEGVAEEYVEDQKEQDEQDENETKEMDMPNIVVKKDKVKRPGLEILQKIFKGEAPKQEITIKAPTGQNEATAADGGNLVYHELANDIFGLMTTGSVIYPKTRKYPVGDRANGVKIPYWDKGGVVGQTQQPRGFWLAEAASKTNTKVTFGQHDLALGKLAFLIPLTDEIMEDVSILKALILEEVRNKIGWDMDNAILNLSTATSGMMGVFDVGSANFLVEPVAHAATYTAAIIRDIVGGVAPSLRGGAEWYMSNQAWVAICGALGPGVANQYNLLADPKAMTLDGKPVNIMEQMANFGTDGDVLLGNFNAGYVCATKGDIKVDISKDFRFDYDETILRLVVRVAGAPVVRSMTLPDTSVVSAFSTCSK